MDLDTSEAMTKHANKSLDLDTSEAITKHANKSFSFRGYR